MTLEDTAERTLSYDRTWYRGKAHRSAVAEVFVTDAVASTDGHVRVAAQTPPCHSFYGDHVPEPSAVDPLLLMEICRQAGLVTAYELGVPVETILATVGWDLQIDAAHRIPFGDAADLLIDSQFVWTRVRNGVPRAGRCRQLVLHQGKQVAELTATSSFLSPGQLAGVRRHQRGDDPPWSHEIPERDSTGVAEPALVGRRNPSNVVVADLLADGTDATAHIVPTLKNRALFDHSYDHVTMQVLSEAARQLTIALIGDPAGSADRLLTRLQGQFERFAELDAPVSMAASISGEPRLVRSTVSATQHDRTTSTFQLEFERTTP